MSSRICHIIACLTVIGFTISCVSKSKQLYEPSKEEFQLTNTERVRLNDSLFLSGQNSMRKNAYGQWELLAMGDPLNLGNSIGTLSSELMAYQEKVFFNRMKKFVPSGFKRYLVKKYMIWYSREISNHISDEYKTELYGLSRHASKNIKFETDAYLRTLYLHGAHDLGHALQDLAVVGCTSFAAWGESTPDGDLLVARNLDFYVGDDFAKNKMIYFIQPERGHAFMSVSWAGMIGVMSGMNVKGLTVTINAGKSDIPSKAKTPVSLLAREILQYAENIEEAIEIAKSREVFVSESILVGSASDNRAVVLEVSPENFGVFQQNSVSRLICSNHFQSEAYQEDQNNKDQIENSHSLYRFNRVEELLNQAQVVTPEKAVGILRDRNGLKNKPLGYGNEKALNQLLAHHGIVFQPGKRRVWVSSNPYQLGDFVSYQLDEVFASESLNTQSFSDESLLIAKDTFLDSNAYKNYQMYRQTKNLIKKAIDHDEYLSEKDILYFKSLNSNYWELYFLIGKYYWNKKYYTAALNEFEKAGSLEIPSVQERNLVEDYINKIKRKLNDS